MKAKKLKITVLIALISAVWSCSPTLPKEDGERISDVPFNLLFDYKHGQYSPKVTVSFNAPFATGMTMTPGIKMEGDTKLGKLSLNEMSSMEFDVIKQRHVYLVVNGN